MSDRNMLKGDQDMQLLLAPEAAELLRIPTNRVYELAKQGLLPCVHIGRYVRFVEDDLIAWIRTGGTVPDTVSSSLAEADAISPVLR